MVTSVQAEALPVTDNALRPQKRTSRRRFAPSPLHALRHVVLWGFALFCLIPIIWLVLAPTKTDGQILNDFPLAFGSFDQVAVAWNGLSRYGDGMILRWALNSLIYVAAGMAGAIGSSLLAGYALAALPFPGRKVVLWVTLIMMVMPGTALVLPLFMELNAMGLIDTMLSVIVTSFLFPFGVYLGFTYFATALPREVLEAARLDGCSELRIFWSIGLPLAKPLVALIAYFSFVGSWNNFFGPYLFLTSEENYNLPVGLGALMAVARGLRPAMENGRGEIALAGVIVVLPILLIFLFVQRYLNTGLLGGISK